MTEIKKVVGYFSGFSQEGSGEAGIGAVIKAPGGAVLWKCSAYIGKRTNSEAEYEAAIKLLKAAAALGVSEIKAHGGSNLVVQHLSGGWNIKDPRLQKYEEEAKEASRGMKVTYVWLPREQNKEAAELSREALAARAARNEPCQDAYCL